MKIYDVVVIGEGQSAMATTKQTANEIKQFLEGHAQP